MSFALFLLYLALTFVRPFELFLPELAGLRPMLVLWALAFAAGLMQAIVRKEIATHPALLGLLAAFTAIIGLSQVVNGWAGGALPAMAEFSTSALLLLLASLNLTTVRRVRMAVMVLVGSLAVAALFGVLAYHRGFHAEQLVLRQSTYNEDIDVPAEVDAVPADDDSGAFIWRVRSVGFLADPNDFGQAMVMALPLLFAGWRARAHLRNAALILVPAGLMLYAVYLTHSRGAVVGLLALVMLGARRRLGNLRTGLLAGVLVMGVLASQMGGGREFSSKEQSAGERVEAWESGLMMLRHKPVLGVGYGNFTDHHHLTAHNSFVLCFAELGVVGYFVWLSMLVLTFRLLDQTLSRAPPPVAQDALSGALRASLIGFLVCAFLLSRTYSPGLFLLLGICAASWWCARAVAGGAPGRGGPQGAWPDPLPAPAVPGAPAGRLPLPAAGALARSGLPLQPAAVAASGSVAPGSAAPAATAERWPLPVWRKTALFLTIGSIAAIYLFTAVNRALTG